MKHLAALLFLFTGIAAAADRPSVHGMLVVGTSKIYLSHLPMFHKPHDYQVILEATLEPGAVRAYQKSLEENPEEKVYTLVPESFSLPLMVQNPKPFKAQLFRGHFERGGSEITGDIQVSISRVLYFQKFADKAEKPNSPSFLFFGNAEEQFVAHLVVARPDFDQVVEVRAQPELAPRLGFAGAILLKSEGENIPLELPNTLKGVTPEGKELQLQPIKELYVEFGDLS